MMRVILRTLWEDARQWDAWLTLHDVNDTHGPTARLRTCYIDKNMPTYVYIDRYIHTHMHTHTYIQRTSRVATSVLSGRLVLAKVQADQKKRIITGSEYSSPPPLQTRLCCKAAPFACKRNTLDKKTSLNISFGTRGSIISQMLAKVGQHVVEEIVNCYDVLSLERHKVRKYWWSRKKCWKK